MSPVHTMSVVEAGQIQICHGSPGFETAEATELDLEYRPLGEAN